MYECVTLITKGMSYVCHHDATLSAVVHRPVTRTRLLCTCNWMDYSMYLDTFVRVKLLNRVRMRVVSHITSVIFRYL